MPPKPPARPARQKRSRATEERILAAAIELMGRRSFDQISVADIARKARISVGGFYARFPSKEALLAWLEQRFAGEILERCARALAPERWEGRRIPPIIGTYLTLAARTFRDKRPLFRQIALTSRGGSDPSFREQIQDLNRQLHGLLRQRLLERRDEIGHQEPESAIDLGLLLVSAGLRETILFSDFNRPSFGSFDLDGLIRELTHAYCAYLRLPSPWEPPGDDDVDF